SVGDFSFSIHHRPKTNLPNKNLSGEFATFVFGEFSSAPQNNTKFVTAMQYMLQSDGKMVF
ncbi:MAG: hypothetical protein N2381_10895, partial [Armatimonadetes bacterium]|nr:hypothetical protein [Armatimonadota bacterium]